MGEPDWTLPHVEPLEWAHKEDGSEGPELDVEIPEEATTQLREGVDKALTLIHSGADVIAAGELIVKALGKHPEWLVALAESAELVGGLAFTVGMPLVLFDQLTTSERVYEQKGFCYGVMWGALGEDSEPKSKAYLDKFNDSERRSFQEGIEKGQKAVDANPQLRDAVRATVVYETSRQTYQTVSEPEQRALNRIWEHVHDKDSIWRGTAAGVRDTGLEWGNPGTQYSLGDPKLDPLKPGPEHTHAEHKH